MSDHRTKALEKLGAELRRVESERDREAYERQREVSGWRKAYDGLVCRVRSALSGEQP